MEIARTNMFTVYDLHIRNLHFPFDWLLCVNSYIQLHRIYGIWNGCGIIAMGSLHEL